jgi:hypothetical protein
MGDGRNFLKNHRATLFTEGISNEPNLAGSISLDSTFNPWTDIEKYYFCKIWFFAYCSKLNGEQSAIYTGKSVTEKWRQLKI